MLTLPGGASRVAMSALTTTVVKTEEFSKMPPTVIVTTPNAEHNVRFEGLAAGMGNLDGDAYDRFMREHDNTWV